MYGRRIEMNGYEVKEYLLKLKSISDILSFLKALIEFGARFELYSGRTVIRETTVDNIFYLDFSRPVLLKIYAARQDETKWKRFRECMDLYAV